MKITLMVKVLSVNEAWQGRRFKTEKYKQFEKEMMFLLPNIRNIPTGKLKISFKVGFSNSLSDIDNFIKPMLDIMQKKYNFNDRDIYELSVKKIITEKGKEFAEIDITSICFGLPPLSIIS